MRSEQKFLLQHAQTTIPNKKKGLDSEIEDYDMIVDFSRSSRNSLFQTPETQKNPRSSLAKFDYNSEKNNSALIQDNTPKEAKKEKIDNYEIMEEKELLNKKNTTFLEKLEETEIDKDQRDSESKMEESKVYEKEKDKENNDSSLRKIKKQIRKYKLILLPESKIKLTWDFVIFFYLIILSLLLPFRLAFIPMEEENELWNVLDVLSTTLFSVDIIIISCSGYYDAEENLILSHSRIFKNYIQGWLLFDIIAVFPFDAILNSTTNLIHAAQFAKIYKLIRLTKLIRLFKIIKETTRFGRQFLELGPGFNRLLYSLLGMIFFCHIASCFWYMLADFNEDYDSWIFYYKCFDFSIFEKYIICFYYVSLTIITVGYGDITPKNTYERVMACFLMFCGAFFYSLTIGNLTSSLNNIDSINSLIYEKKSKLLCIRNQFHIPFDLYKRIQRSISIKNNITSDQKLSLLNELPPNLKIELSYLMFESLVKDIEFFKNKPKKFIGFVGIHLKKIKIEKNEIVISQGEASNDIYFIKKGQVSVSLKEFGNFSFINIKEGYYFGEIDILFDESAKFNYISDTECTLLSLNRLHFLQLFFREFQEIGKQFYRNALKRRNRNNQISKQAIEFCTRTIENHLKKEKNNLAPLKEFKPEISMVLMTQKTRFNENRKSLMLEKKKMGDLNERISVIEQEIHQRDSIFRLSESAYRRTWKRNLTKTLSKIKRKKRKDGDEEKSERKEGKVTVKKLYKKARGVSDMIEKINLILDIE